MVQLYDCCYVVDRVVAIVDRQEDGEADVAMKESKLELISLFTLKDFTDDKDE